MLGILTYKKEISKNLFEFVVKAPEIARTAKAGQFVHVLCGGDSYLRRPISICETPGSDLVRFIFEIRGEGTRALSQKTYGDEIDLLGPLGNGFDTSITANGAVLLVGGGIGIFPLLQLAKDFGGRATALLGFRSANAVVMDKEFAKSCKNLFLATDDGSCGYHGFVTDILENIAQNNRVGAIYTCGPKPMMKLVADIAKKYDIPAQASMEERMGCGIGACVTCTCKVGGENKRVCKDGPVFDAKEVSFDE